MPVIVNLSLPLHVKTSNLDKLPPKPDTAKVFIVPISFISSSALLYFGLPSNLTTLSSFKTLTLLIVIFLASDDKTRSRSLTPASYKT